MASSNTPRLITCDISGYGAGGAASELKAYDLLVQCESGLAGISGSPESYGRIGVSICDSLGMQRQEWAELRSPPER